jgi:alpha-tubulin suppressor-like RCC1 family protein
VAGGELSPRTRPSLRKLVATAIALAAAAAPLASQVPAPGESGEVEQVVVMIRCTLAGRESIGAGILFGAANDRLYVVTANHVLRLGAEEATNIRVELRALPGEPVAATLTTTFDARRDLAVLSVGSVKALGIDVARLPFDRLGAPASLARGDGVFALGYPQGRPWGVNVAPMPMSATNDSLLTFETTLVSPGHSGGALLNQRREIVGLLLNVQPPEATARNIAQVLEVLREWRFPLALRGRFALTEPEVVSAGAGFTCALRRDGTAFCWGSNDHGELGSGTRGGSLSPVPVSTALKFASVSAGWSYACALTIAGAPYCWGDAQPDDVGPVPGNLIERRVPILVVADLTFSSLSAGFQHACGVTGAGVAYCWGENDDGQLGNGSTSASIAPVRVATSVTFRSVSAGLNHSCGLATDGAAYCWGDGRLGALGAGDRASHDRPVSVAGDLRFSTLSAGNLYTCAVTTTGAAYCWGRNDSGELGDGTTTQAVAPRAVSGGHRFRTVSAKRATGRSVTCGLTVNAAALCWGWESEALGQLEIPGTRPAPVVGALVFGSLSVGFSHVCGIVTSGGIYCWGDDRHGQLGDGATAARVTPGLVPIPP